MNKQEQDKLKKQFLQKHPMLAIVMNESHQTKDLLKKIVGTLIGCFSGSLVALHSNYKAEKKSLKPKKIFLRRIRYTLTSTYFLQTSATFCAKILTDTYQQIYNLNNTEYYKGAIVGIISFLVNTPLKRIHQMQNKVLDPQHNKINKTTAANFMLKRYGFSSFYQGEKIVNLINSAQFYALYFGIYSTLSQKYNHNLEKYIGNTFLASVAATFTHFLVSRVSNLSYSIRQDRYIRAVGSGFRVMPHYSRSVFLETILNLNKIFKMPLQDKKIQLNFFLTNWLMLAIFVSTQEILVEYNFVPFLRIHQKTIDIKERP